jgi:undecaprenyl-diphosphatase
LLLIKDYITKLDDIILNFVSIKLKNTILDTTMPKVTWLNNYGQVYLLFALISIYNNKFNKWGKAIILSLLLEVTICELLIKPLCKRSRPVIASVKNNGLLIKKPLSYSFPSGHTASSFAVVGVLWNMDSGYKYLILIIALLVSFSRVYLLVHYPSDILAGMVLGFIVGKFTVELYYEQHMLIGLIIIFSLIIFRVFKNLIFKEESRYENTFSN